MPTTDRPIWLLDFDGVVNAVTRKVDRNVWNVWSRVEIPVGGVTYPIHYAHAVIGFIQAVEKAGVEIVWLSTWGRHTGQFPEALRLPDLAYIPSPQDYADLRRPAPLYYEQRAWWKGPAGLQYVAKRPVLWTDDDLAMHPEVGYQLDRLASSRLIVSPQTHLGLTPKHLAQIVQWLKQNGVEVPWTGPEVDEMQLDAGRLSQQLRKMAR